MIMSSLRMIIQTKIYQYTNMIYKMNDRISQRSHSIKT